MGKFMWLQSLFGFFILLLLAWGLSECRHKVAWKTIFAGVILQWVLAVILIKLPIFTAFFEMLNGVLLQLQQATSAGTTFVFGYLAGGATPFEVTHPANNFILALQALPLVLVMSALSALLFYWKILPLVVKGFSWLLRKAMGIGGSVAVSAAANVFVGMVEAPLLIKPYLKTLSRGELFMVMTLGMATVAGTVMALYATFLSAIIPNAMGHILVASLISAPAAIVVSLLMIPTDANSDGKPVELTDATSSMDAITKGTAQGVQLLLSIVAMLVVLVALVSLLNAGLSLLPNWNGEAISLQRMLGEVMRPLVWLMGVPWSESSVAGSLLGTKVVLTEFLAYLDMSQLDVSVLSQRSQIIMTYGLCGFASFTGLAIMIGGMTSLVPERHDDIVSLGIKSIVAGTIATCMTGAVIGVVY